MIIRGKIVYVYDIEVFQNIFHCSVKNTETNNIYKFEISERKNQLRELVKFFKQVDKYITWGDYYTTNINIPANVIFCGYNNLHYDNPIINYIIEYETKNELENVIINILKTKKVIKVMQELIYATKRFERLDKKELKLVDKSSDENDE